MPRQAAYYHLVEHGGLKATEVGALMGVRVVTVSLGAIRFRERLAQDPDMKKKIESLSIM